MQIHVVYLSPLFQQVILSFVFQYFNETQISNLFSRSRTTHCDLLQEQNYCGINFHLWFFWSCWIIVTISLNDTFKLPTFIVLEYKHYMYILYLINGEQVRSLITFKFVILFFLERANSFFLQILQLNIYIYYAINYITTNVVANVWWTLCPLSQTQFWICCLIRQPSCHWKVNK